MSRMWKIMEEGHPYEGYRHGGMSEEIKEAYECGYEEGFGAAMKHVEKEKYGSRMGYRDEMSSYRNGSYGNRMGYRDEDDEIDERMGERRRRRDSRGRYM